MHLGTQFRGGGVRQNVTEHCLGYDEGGGGLGPSSVNLRNC